MVTTLKAERPVHSVPPNWATYEDGADRLTFWTRTKLFREIRDSAVNSTIASVLGRTIDPDHEILGKVIVRKVSLLATGLSEGSDRLTWFEEHRIRFCYRALIWAVANPSDIPFKKVRLINDRYILNKFVQISEDVRLFSHYDPSRPFSELITYKTFDQLSDR